MQEIFHHLYGQIIVLVGDFFEHGVVQHLLQLFLKKLEITGFKLLGELVVFDEFRLNPSHQVLP